MYVRQLTCKCSPLAEKDGIGMEVVVGEQTSLYCTVQYTYGLHKNVIK
jgi:hypothetical protein